MNRLFNTNYNHRSLDIAVFILRVAIALLMLSHGIPKFNMLLAGGAISFPDPLGVGSILSLVMAVFAEVFCSILLLLGFATRLAVLPLIITMLVAVFMIHGNDGMKEKEMGLHYLLTYVLLLFSGGGRFSVDSMISVKGSRSKRGY